MQLNLNDKQPIILIAIFIPLFVCSLVIFIYDREADRRAEVSVGAKKLTEQQKINQLTDYQNLNFDGKYKQVFRTFDADFDYRVDEYVTASGEAGYVITLFEDREVSISISSTTADTTTVLKKHSRSIGFGPEALERTHDWVLYE